MRSGTGEQERILLVDSVESSEKETAVRVLLQKVLSGKLPLESTDPILRGTETIRLRGSTSPQTDLVVKGGANTRQGVVESFMASGVSSHSR